MLFSCAKESFQNVLSSGREGFNKENSNYIAMLLTLLLWLAVLLFVSKFLWNEVLVKLVTVVKPATSVAQILGLVILLEIMIPK